LEWVGDKTIEQAWETCQNPEWMLWILTKTDLDLTDPICDMAEEVLHLVPKECQLACIWALDAAKRRAKRDELDAAEAAVYRATYDIGCNSYATASAANAIYYVIARINEFDHAYAGILPDVFVNSAAAAARYVEKQNNQCNILRKYFSIEQVKEAFNKLAFNKLVAYPRFLLYQPLNYLTL
jgi:hypothetical protein